MLGLDQVEGAALVIGSPAAPVAVTLAKGTHCFDARSRGVGQGNLQTVSEGETVKLIEVTICPPDRFCQPPKHQLQSTFDTLG